MRTPISRDQSHHPAIRVEPGMSDREFVVIAFDKDSQEVLRDRVTDDLVRARVTAFGAFAAWVGIAKVKPPLLATG